MYEPRPIPHLRKGLYFTITNCANGLALSMPKTNKYTKDKPQFQQLNTNNINQIWMLDEISPNRYEIVHAVSTLVLEGIVGSNNCKLQFGKQKSSQLYFLEEGWKLDKFRDASRIKRTEQISYQPPHPHVVQQAMQEQKIRKQVTRSIIKTEKKAYRQSAFKAGQRFVAQIRIKQKQNSRKYLYCEQISKVITVPLQQDQKRQTQVKTNVLKYMQIDINNVTQSSLWQIREVLLEQNQILAQTCYIASFRSGDVLDVPAASDKQGIQIIQYPCNFRFNQKWILKKVDEVGGYGYYMIMNAKTGHYLDIKGELAKAGTPIIQWENHEGKNQIWRLEEQGKRTYLIRSAMDQTLLLGVKENSLKQEAEIVTSKVETECFWYIYGFIPE